MVCSAMKSVVTFVMSFDFHTTSLENPVAFIDEETEAEGKFGTVKGLAGSVWRS